MTRRDWMSGRLALVAIAAAAVWAGLAPVASANAPVKFTTVIRR